MALLLVWLGGVAAPLRAQDCQTKSAPPAAFQASCSGVTCTFNLTSSSAGITNLRWDFGDGATASGAALSVTHTYPSTGGYFLITLTVTATDGTQAVATGSVSLGGVSVPLATDDELSTEVNKPLVIGVAELLSNDAPGVTFDHADLACRMAADGASCTWTPPPGFVGVTSFQYWVRDSGNTSGSATVHVTVAQPLAANPDQFTLRLTKDVRTIRITSEQLLDNDTPDNPVFMGTENPMHGTLQLTETNATDGYVYTFTPESCFLGDATFEYLISLDGNPPYERGFVTITVIGGPHAVFTARCGVSPDPPRLCRVDTTSTDDGCVPLRYFWNWGDGTPTVEVTTPYGWAPQSHTYATSGRFTITHTVSNPSGQSDSLQLDVLPNTRPVSVTDSATTDRDVPVTIPVLANDSDADGDALSINSVTLTQPGAGYQVIPNGTSWAIRFTPPDSFVGTANFSYVAADRWGGASASTGVTVTVKQWTVIVDALGEQLYTPQNTSLRIPLATLLANDYSDNGALTIVSYDTAILMGTLDCTTETTACTYRPPINGAGLTLFKYKACDSAGHCDTATVRLYVGFRGTGPAAADDYFTTTRNTAKTFAIQELVQNDSDVDGDTLSVSLISGARDYGSLSCSTPMYKCTYTPNSGFVGKDRFQYTVTDVMNPAVSAFINVLTLPPSTATFDAREDVRVTGVNQQTYITYAGLAANDFAPLGDPISVSSVDTSGLIGTLTCDSGGCLYKPGSTFQGTTRFKYTAGDTHGGTDTAIVKIRVGGTNTAPKAFGDSLTTPKNTVLRFSSFELLRNDYDEDNDPLTTTVYPATTAKGTLSCDAKGYWCTYTPLANVTGADTFNYVLGDGTTSVSSTFTVNIQP
jgi:hypothetical protein